MVTENWRDNGISLAGCFRLALHRLNKQEAEPVYHQAKESNNSTNPLEEIAEALINAKSEDEYIGLLQKRVADFI